MQSCTSAWTWQSFLMHLKFLYKDPSQTGGAAGNRNDIDLDMLMSMLGGLGTGGAVGVPENPNVPPEEVYATQLSQLEDMGFSDLQATCGNVHAAVERLLGNA